MKSTVGYILFAVAAYAAFLLASFPADRAYAMFKHRLPPQVQLYGIDGSVWHGEADVAQVGAYRLAPLSWHYRPLGLLSGRLDVGLRFREGPGRAAGVVGVYPTGGLHMGDLDAAVPVSELVRLLDLPMIDLEGSLELTVDDARLKSSHITALDGTLTWRKAQVVKPAAYRLGDLEARFSTKNGVVNGTLKDNGGPLQMDGIVILKPDGTYQLNVNLANRDATQPGLTQLLHSLGRPGPGGKVIVTQSGKLPAIP